MTHSPAMKAVDSSYGVGAHRPQLKKANSFAAPDLRLKSLMGGPQLKRSSSEIANQGFGGSGSSVPHLKSMQQSFGGIDFSGVRAHSGTPQAKEACDSMGAEAYAMDGQVAFKSANPSPSLVAHELTHVVQQGHAGPQKKEEKGKQEGGEGEEEDDEEGEKGQEDGDNVGDPEAEAEAVEANVAAGQPAMKALKSGGGSAGPATKLHRKPQLKLDRGIGAGITLSKDDIELSGSVSFNIPTTPIPLFTGVFIDLSAGFNLQVAGAAGLKGGGKVAVTGSAQASAGLALGIPNVISGGFYVTAQVPISGEYSKDKDGNTFFGIKFEPGFTTDVRITVGPGWWTRAYKLSDTKVILASMGWKNGKYQGFEWDWSPEMKELGNAIKQVWETAKNLVAAGWNAVKKTAKKVWNFLTSW